MELWTKGQKSINCMKRKANLVKLCAEEFEEIKDELYPIKIENFNEISSYCESIEIKKKVF